MKTSLPTTCSTDCFELWVIVDFKEIFRAFYAPAFPHPKNIYASIVESKCVSLNCVLNKINNKDWSEINPGEWRLNVVCNQRKYVFTVKKLNTIFCATAPMLLAAYNE